MPAIEGLGDIISGIGDIKPSTLQALHEREKLGLEQVRQKSLEEYGKSQLGLASKRIEQSIAAANERAKQFEATFNQRERLAGAAREQQAREHEAQRTFLSAQSELRAMERSQDLKERLATQEQMQKERLADRNAIAQAAREQQRSEFDTRMAMQAQFHEDNMALRREMYSARLEAAGQKTRDKAVMLTTIEDVVGKIDKLIPAMEKEGLLSKTDSRYGLEKARVQRWLHAGSPTLAQWIQLQPAMVGFDRTVLNDLGMRAQAAYNATLHFFDHPTSVGAAHAVVEQWKSILATSKATRGGSNTPPLALPQPDPSSMSDEDLQKEWRSIQGR